MIEHEGRGSVSGDGTAGLPYEAAVASGILRETRPRLVKLVRDRVGQFLPPGGTGVWYAPIADFDGPTAAVQALRRKGVEEATEYLEKPSLGELADMYEAIRALAVHDLGLSVDAVIEEAGRKRAERGGFDDLVGMYVETTATPRQ